MGRYNALQGVTRILPEKEARFNTLTNCEALNWPEFNANETPPSMGPSFLNFISFGIGDETNDGGQPATETTVETRLNLSERFDINQSTISLI